MSKFHTHPTARPAVCWALVNKNTGRLRTYGDLDGRVMPILYLTKRSAAEVLGLGGMALVYRLARVQIQEVTTTIR